MSSSSPHAAEEEAPAQPAAPTLPGIARGNLGIPDMLEDLAVSASEVNRAWFDDSSEERLDENGLGSGSFCLFLGGRPRFLGSFFWGSSLPGCK